MPFDKLPAHDLSLPQLHPYIAPGRPIFPTNEVVQNAMDKIMSALDPYERAKRTLGMAQIRQELQFLPLRQQMMRSYLQGGNNDFKMDAQGRLIPLTPQQKAMGSIAQRKDATQALDASVNTGQSSGWGPHIEGLGISGASTLPRGGTYHPMNVKPFEDTSDQLFQSGGGLLQPGMVDTPPDHPQAPIPQASNPPDEEEATT